MSAKPTLSLGEPADEADWRALVEKGLKGAGWDKLIAKTADGIPIQPLYREPDIHTAMDVSGLPGAAPFIRGARHGAWAIRQIYDHPSPEQTNRDILTDLEGGVSSIEVVTHFAGGARGVRIVRAQDLDLVLAGVFLDAAPVALDAGQQGFWLAEQVAAKLRGASGEGVAFNLDPLASYFRSGGGAKAEMDDAVRFARAMGDAMPAATTLRADARPVHEAGGTEAQEIAAALASGVTYLRALTTNGMSAAGAARTILFTLAVGPDTLIEAAKLRALRLCWARILEASGVEPAHRAARIHAVTSRRMMTRYDAWSNILRTTTAAFGAAVGGADAITTLPFTDALGLPTPLARRIARNTPHVLLEESRLGHVADPAGGSWFVEKLTRELAATAWAKLQAIETKGGLVADLDVFWREIAEARAARQARINSRRESITGISDFPLLDAVAPDFEPIGETQDPSFEGPIHALDSHGAALTPIRWAAPFEHLRDAMEQRKPRPAIFFANIGALPEFGVRAQWARNLFAAGGVGSIGEEDAHANVEAAIAAFGAAARVALIAGTDEGYAEHAETYAQRLKAAGADWVVLAGKPGVREAALRAAGVDQFVFAAQDAVEQLQTLHSALLGSGMEHRT
ncbi:MAG: methylmalonyl-CoA mutase family protein [Hyphomonadaceae bacterium]